MRRPLTPLEGGVILGVFVLLVLCCLGVSALSASDPAAPRRLPDRVVVSTSP